MEILSESKPVAKKRHICDLCDCAIEKGTKYYRQANKDGSGEIRTFRAHTECWELVDELDMFKECSRYDGIDNYFFQEFINDYVGDNYPEKEREKLYSKPYYEMAKQILEDETLDSKR